MMKLAKSLKICLTTSNFAPTPLHVNYVPAVCIGLVRLAK